MSGGRFIVSLREVYKSESIIKLKSLFKYELEVPIGSFWEESTIQDFLNEIHTLNFEFVSLSDDTNEVIVFLAGYISRFLKKKLKCSDCMMFLERDTVYSAYFETVNRGKLTRPSSALNFTPNLPLLLWS